MRDKFFITTPIYYTNWVPHIWHAYSSLIADSIVRYQKINGKKTKFSTWVDENSQKALIKAQELWMEIMPYLDLMASKHKSVWDWLKIEYTDFIRTTQDRHHKLVREVLQKSFDIWDIYSGNYEWMYCVWCEAFKKDDDLIEKDWKKVCPDHLVEPQKLKEKNYFFKLSKYQTWLEEFYEANPSFVMPQDRFNEVIAFVKRWLDDFSISRETNKFGIKLPFDEDQVTYVWYDALFNYVTVCRENDYWIDESDFWPADLHVVWKDIIRFHAIYWPAMLASSYNLWEEINWVLHYKETDKSKLPQNILTTWFFTVDWLKISKSLWNVIDPVEFSQKYSRDLLSLYLLSSFNIGQDWDFSEKQAILTYNAKLANNFWNLVNRVVVLALKLDWVLHHNLDENYEIKMNFWDFNVLNIWWVEVNYNWFSKFFEEMHTEFEGLFNDYNLKWVLDLAFKVLDELNNYTTQKEPWQMIKDPVKLDETLIVLSTIAEWLRQIWMILYPFFPEKMAEMFEKIGLEWYKEILENGWLKDLVNKKEIFKIKEKWNPLFSRFDVE